MCNGENIRMPEDNYKVDELRCDEHKGTCYDCWKECKVCELNLDKFYSRNMYSTGYFGVYLHWLGDDLALKHKMKKL